MTSNKSLGKPASAKEIAERISKISHDLLEVAEDLVTALDERPALAEELAGQGVNRELIRRLERLGRGQIHPRLVFATAPGALRLLTVPLSEQTQALELGIEVMDDDEEGVRKLPISDMSPKQARLAIGGGRIRSLAEQRTAIREEKKKVVHVERDVDYRVHRDHVATSKPGKWSKALIIQWLAEMG